MNQKIQQPEEQYWPFDVLPEDQQSPLHRQEIRFLETAYREGYKPYTFGAGDYGAGAEERSGLILVRGRKRWEAVLGKGDAKVGSVFLEDFDRAAEAVLEWLRGKEAFQMLAQAPAQAAAGPAPSRTDRPRACP
jgi:hypothetical protein